MFRLFRALIFNFCVLLIAGALAAQSASSSPTPTPSAATPPKGVSATPSPTPVRSPSREELIDSLSAADVQAALTVLKKSFANPDAVDDVQIGRATLQGLLVRLNKGLLLLPGKEATPPETPAPFYAEVLEDHIGYIRFGTINSTNLQALDKRLADFAAKKVDALIIDLRASDSGDFASAAEFGKRFVPKGKTLFSLRKQDKQDHPSISDRDPPYAGLIAVLVDGDTSGPAEAIAVALRTHDKALIIGQPSAGSGVEYSDQSLPSGRILRVAVAQCIGADGRRLYPDGVTPDLPVEMSAVDKRQIFRLSMSKGMASFTREMERPHLNEAALIAGTNPELETSDQRRNRVQANALVDAVLQRGLDLITSLEIYRKR
jgi:hypothetical protein